jgi:hypothetical protein
MVMMRFHEGVWAAAEDLRIPTDVRRCVHMVAAHEVRGSFPVDLVDGANCGQIIYPRISRIRG